MACRYYRTLKLGGNPGPIFQFLCGVTGHALRAISALVRTRGRIIFDGLTRANVMRQAASIRNLELPMLLPGIKINTSPTDFHPIESMMLARFDGAKWVLFGDVIDASQTM